MARTAVVAGTATAVSNRVSRRQSERWSQQDQQYYQEPAPAPAAPAQGGDDRLAELQDLANLKTQGILNDQEFAAEKARILAS